MKIIFDQENLVLASCKSENKFGLYLAPHKCQMPVNKFQNPDLSLVSEKIPFLHSSQVAFLFVSGFILILFDTKEEMISAYESTAVSSVKIDGAFSLEAMAVNSDGTILARKTPGRQVKFEKTTEAEPVDERLYQMLNFP